MVELCFGGLPGLDLLLVWWGRRGTVIGGDSGVGEYVGRVEVADEGPERRAGGGRRRRRGPELRMPRDVGGW